MPASSTPVLPAQSKREKQRRITNQEVLKLQAEVLQHHKEVRTDIEKGEHKTKKSGFKRGK